jgi:DNA-binding PadR family transcriptional regulator
MEDSNQRLNTKIIGAYVPIIILQLLLNNEDYSYGIYKKITLEFGILISPTIVYQTLKTLQQKKLLSIQRVERKKTYKITEKGRLELQQLIKKHHLITQKLNEILQIPTLKPDTLLIPDESKGYIIFNKKNIIFS